MFYLIYIYSLCLASFLLTSRSLSFPLDPNIDVAALIEKFNHGISITRTVQIYSSNSGHHVRVIGRKVDGRGMDGAESGKMMLESVNLSGHIRIRSIKENSYICVSDKGTLVVESKGNTIDRCLFVERQLIKNGFTAFESVYNPEWYLGIQRLGKAKAPKHTKKKQKAALFLVRVLPNN